MSTEVLSPAGTFDAVTAAVRSGCDAVYLGAELFNARRNAENFNQTELKKAVSYCHQNGVLVYLTLNICVGEGEMRSALNEAYSALKCGVDAFIVADLGLAMALKKSFPGIQLHGSTQISVHSPAALPILKQMGFKRIVVAREMSLNALKDFCEKAKAYGIEVEVFIHGALCMCLSGQCYLSAVLGSRSGNRGLCAGPCRLPFKAENGSGYDLSLKDLSLLEHVNTLKEIGVCSLKIEGRMKRPEYVAAVTLAARHAVDFGFVPENISKLLNGIFSRSGFTSGYFKNTVDKSMFGIRTKEDVALSANAVKELHALYRNERQRVKISAHFKVKANEPASLTFNCENHSCTVFGAIPQKAKSKPLDYDFAFKQLSKLGSTPYILSELTTDFDLSLALSSADLNAIRRSACEQLNILRSATCEVEYNTEFLDNFTPQKTAVGASLLSGRFARFDNAAQIPLKAKDLCGIILPLGEDFKRAYSVNTNLFAQMPRGCDDDALLAEKLKEAIPYIRGAFCGTLSAVSVCRELNVPIIGDFGLNIYNSLSAEVLNQLGAIGFCASFENKLSDISLLKSPLKKGVITYGRLPLMIFKNCPIKANIGCKSCNRNSAVTDRKNISFPLLCRFGYTELYNSTPLNLADKQSAYSFADFEILYFTTETFEQAEQVIISYEIGSPPISDYTRGLYFKGVL